MPTANRKKQQQKLSGRRLPEADVDASVRFALHLGTALHRYGAPAHRLEDVMTGVAAGLGLEARFVSTPTAIYASFGEPEALSATLIRAEPGELDLDRLVRVDAIVSKVLAGRASAAEGVAAIDAVVAEPPPYGAWFTTLCHALSAGAGAQLFGGGLREVLVAFVLGGILGTLALAAARSAGLARCFELVAAFVVSAGSMVGTHLIGPYSPGITTLAALVYLLPGLTLTVAMTELATRNLVSGTSRLTGAAVVLLQLGFGVALGRRVDDLLPALPAPAVVAPLPPWTTAPTLAVITLALAVLFRARLRHAGWILVAAVTAYAGGRFGAHLLGPELGAFAGALSLGVGANVVARWRNLPALLTLTPGVMLLVPGSLGFRSIESLLAQDVVGGLTSAFSTLMVLVGLAGGILLANSILAPRGTL